jgi:hypothetical protein
MALQYPNRNGFLYSFQSTQVLEGGELFKGLLGGKVSPKIDGRKMVTGNGRIAYGRTRGQLMVEGSLTFLADAFFDYQRDKPAFFDLIHNLVVVFEEGSRRDKIALVELTLDSVDVSFEGTEELRVEIPFAAIDCLINDLSLVQGDALGLQNDAGSTT